MSELIGPTCLYKDGGSQIFEGEAVTKALSTGWKDTPTNPIDDDVINVPVKKKRAPRKAKGSA